MHLEPYYLIFKANLAKDMSYRFNFLFAYALRITQLLLYLVVWSLIFKDQTQINGYTWNEMATYFALITITTMIFYPNHMFEMQPLIRKGTLSSFLIKPINFEMNVLAKFLASKVPSLFIMSFFVMGLFYLLKIDMELSINYLSLSIMLASLFLTFYFGLFISVLAFWLVEMWPLRRIFQGCMALFGGVIAPLELLPNYLVSISHYTPFPYLGYFSVKVIQGAFTQGELIYHFFMILFWISLFLVGFKFLWKAGLRQYEAVNL